MAIDLESLLKLGASLPMEDKLALVAELARLAQQDARDQSFGFETAAVYDSFHGPSVTDPSGTTTHARNATQLVCPPAFHMDHLSHGVMTHYGLARADVLKITMDDKDSTDPAIRSDMIHSALAKYAAGELVRFIKQGDVKCVATGSGRGAALTCLYIAMALKDKSPNEWFHHLTVLPLTGYIGASPWSHWPLEVFGAEPLPKGLELDAWCAAESLARVSWHSRIYRLALPVVLPTEISKSTASQFANANGLPISVEGWKRDKSLHPMVCVVGIGALRQGHRLLTEPVPVELRPITRHLKTLLEMVKNNEIVVGDLCNRLFVASARRGNSVLRVPPEAREACKSINDRLLTVDVGHFLQAERVVVVTGGSEKNEVLLQVLLHARDNDYCRKIWLITDEACVKGLPIPPELKHELKRKRVVDMDIVGDLRKSIRSVIRSHDGFPSPERMIFAQMMEHTSVTKMTVTKTERARTKDQKSLTLRRVSTDSLVFSLYTSASGGSMCEVVVAVKQGEASDVLDFLRSERFSEFSAAIDTELKGAQRR